MLHRAFYFVVFTALGVFCAEVVSGNIPFAVVLPPIYAVYGLLYIHFIDLSARRGVRSPANWYLWGVLVGLISETYVAKVMIFGLGNDTVFLFGVPVVTLLFLGFFYHAFYSFLLPVYIGRRFLGMPFPIAPSRTLDVAVFVAPFLILPSVTTAHGGDLRYMLLALVSCVSLIGIVALMKVFGPRGNILMSAKERIGALVLTLAGYVFFFVKFTNSKQHGHVGVLDFPMLPMVLMTALIVALLALNIWSIRRTTVPLREVEFDPAGIRLGKLALFVGAYLLTLPFLLPPLAPAVAALLPVLAVGGSTLGTVAFAVAVYRAVRAGREDRSRLEAESMS